MILIIIALLSILFTFTTTTDVPIIGILAQEIYNTNKTESYIAASYVKFVESAGARAVPVWIGQNQSYYESIVNYTNGLLFPGGGVYFNESGGYGEAAGILYDLAIEANDRGVYYPVWGTCLGMQVIMYAIAQKYITIGCSVKYVALPLEFSEGYNSTKLFPQSSEITDILGTDNVTYNNHIQCLPEEPLQDEKLQNWKVISTNKDTNANITFVSLMENTKYPFYGTQFHPEKNVFEFKEGQGLVHTGGAVKVSQYFSNFFVNESRKNDNTFPDKDLEVDSLIYNYLPTYTGRTSSFEQKYNFLKSDVDSSPLVNVITTSTGMKIVSAVLSQLLCFVVLFTLI